jgi:hypothetical protein
MEDYLRIVSRSVTLVIFLLISSGDSEGTVKRRKDATS